MKQVVAEVYAKSEMLREVWITRAAGGGWQVAFFGEGGEPLSDRPALIETARGEVRTWASLDTAQRWLESLAINTETGARVSIGW